MEETKQEKNEAEIEHENELGEDAQIESEVERVKKKRREAIFELSLFFILGVLIGITVKTEAVKRITIGFNDYQIQKPTDSYNIGAIKKRLDAEFTEQQTKQQQQIQSQQGQQEQQEQSAEPQQ